NTKQACALGCPVARGAATVFCSSQYDKRSFILYVLHGCIIYCKGFVGWKISRETAFCICNLVFYTHIRKCSPHHSFWVTAARTKGVKIFSLYTFAKQIFSGSSRFTKCSSRGNMICSN